MSPKDITVFHRHYRNCLKDLRDLQAERALAPDPKPEPPNEPKPPTPTDEIPTPAPAEKQATPNEPKLTPEEARALAEKAKIQRIMDINLGRIPFPGTDPFPIR